MQAQQLLAARLDGLKASVNLLEGQASKAADVVKLQADAASAQQDAKKKSAALDLASKAEMQARKARDATHLGWVAGQAARLAASLVADQPCPVCGSTHHPSPAHSVDRAEGETDEIVDDVALEAAEEALRLAEQAQRAARTEYDDAARQLQSLQLRIDDLKKDLGEASPSAAELKQSLVAAQKDLKTAQVAFEGLTSAQVRVDAAAKAVALEQERFNHAETQARTAQLQREQCQAVLTEREKEVPPELAVPEHLQEVRAHRSSTVQAAHNAP